jgi:hypothetical protein
MIVKVSLLGKAHPHRSEPSSWEWVMELGILIAIVSAAIAVVALVPATLGWLETRRQRLANAPVVSETSELETLEEGREWIIGIYDYTPLSKIDILRPWAAVGPFVTMAKYIGAQMGIPYRLIEFTYTDFYDKDKKHPISLWGCSKLSVVQGAYCLLDQFMKLDCKGYVEKTLLAIFLKGCGMDL